MGECSLHDILIYLETEVINNSYLYLTFREAPNLDINNLEVEQHLHLVFDNAAGLREVEYILQRFFTA